MTLPSNVASLAIDPQPTFCEEGGLAVSGGNAIMPKINDIRSQTENGYWTQDWHPAEHSSFASTHGREPFTKVWLKDGNVVADFIEGEEGPAGAIVQMLWTDHGIENTEEAKLHPILHVPKNDLVLRKGNNPKIDSYSCVFENDKITRPRFANGNTLPDQLRSDGIDTVVLSGLALDVCVHDGAVDLKNEGFRVVVVIDACAAISPEGKAAALADFKKNSIEVCTTEELRSFFKSAPSYTQPAPGPK